MPAQNWGGEVTDRIACANNCGFKALASPSCEWGGWCNAYAVAAGHCMIKKKKECEDGYNYYCQRCIRLPKLILNVNAVGAEECWAWYRNGLPTEAWLRKQVCKPCYKSLKANLQELQKLDDVKALIAQAEQRQARGEDISSEDEDESENHQNAEVGSNLGKNAGVGSSLSESKHKDNCADGEAKSAKGEAPQDKSGAAAAVSTTVPQHYVADVDEELAALKLELHKLKSYLSSKSSDGVRTRAMRPDSYEHFDPDEPQQDLPFIADSGSSSAAADSCVAPPGLSWNNSAPSAPPMMRTSETTPVIGNIVGIWR